MVKAVKDCLMHVSHEVGDAYDHEQKLLSLIAGELDKARYENIAMTLEESTMKLFDKLRTENDRLSTDAENSWEALQIANRDRDHWKQRYEILEEAHKHCT